MAGSTLPVSITSSTDPADAGVPFVLTANVPGPVGGYFYNWTDSRGGSNAAPTWTLDLGTSGNLTVTLVVLDPAGDRGTATSSISVVAAPTVTVSSPLTQVEVDIPIPFTIDVTGGVPPLTASWVSSDGGSNGSLGGPTDGNYSAEVEFTSPGPAWVLVRVIDVLGASSSTAELLTEVVPGGSVGLDTRESVAEVGWPTQALVDVENGAPPFRWSLSSSVPLAGGPNPFGVFPSDGLYGWNLTFASVGTANLSLTLVDALGAVTLAALALMVEPALSVNVTLPDERSAAPFEIDADVSGGVPPYAYQIELSDGQEANGTLVAPGMIAAAFDGPPSGNYSLEVRVTDQLGQSWGSTQDLRFAGNPSPASPPTEIGVSNEGATIALIGVTLIAGLYLYRRFGRPVPPVPSREPLALAAVRRLMKQSQVIDHDTLVLLGEEGGESAEAVETALRALIRAGEVTTEPGPTNDEVLRWRASSEADDRSGAAL